MPAGHFEHIRTAALRHVADAEDWLRSDWSDQPSRRQLAARHRAALLLAQVHGIMDEMAERPSDRR